MTATEFGPSAPVAAAAIDGTGVLTTAPATRFRRRAMGLAAVAGGALTAAGFATTVWEVGPEKLDYLDSLVVDPFRSQIAALLLHYGYLGIVPALLALGIMTRRRWTVSGNIGLALSLVGALALPGLLVTDFYDIAIRQSLPPEDAVRVSDAAQALPLSFLIGGPFILAMFVGMLVAAISAWRAGFFHWLGAVPLVVGTVLPMVVPFGTLPNIISGAGLGLFLILVGVAALRMTDEEWVSGRKGAGRVR
ncbi:hypothetical protein [Pseudonocardia sp.]|jgi:hypothetical protein|uniref:hypothetical protein n=1 Tax=Pseudonocardia sp. TaxID=60912 RepID=UPI002D9BEF16|nr:hypothetical protein [Pseudonocardia sp.]